MNRRYAAAYYLCGYAVECGLKACIARQIRRHEFPPSSRFSSDVYTHDLSRLVTLAGLTDSLASQITASPGFESNWLVVKNWSEHSRYESRTRREAEDLLAAVTQSPDGVMEWIRSYW